MGADVDRRGLQENVGLLAPAAAPLDPEYGIAFLRLQKKSQLDPQFLGATSEIEDFLRFRRQCFEFRTQAQ